MSFPTQTIASDFRTSEWPPAAPGGDATLAIDDDWDSVPTAPLELGPAEALADASERTKTEHAWIPIRKRRDVTPGTVLAERFLVGRLLGAGGSSLIFQCEDRARIGAADFGNRIAIKILRPEMRANEHALTRLRREFRQMKRLDHRGVARVYELGCDSNVWFMTMELIEGQTINQWLKTDVDNSQALRVIAACCEALHHAHTRGVVHGDLKPSNVLVLPNGTVKLVDFGSAAERDASLDLIDTHERSFAATPQYASPQVLKGEAAEPRDDVFSLACLTYTVLSRGGHPFERKSSMEALELGVRPKCSSGLPPQMFDVIVRALAWQRAERPSNVREFLHALLISTRRLEPASVASTPAKPSTGAEPQTSSPAVVIPAAITAEIDRPARDLSELKTEPVSDTTESKSDREVVPAALDEPISSAAKPDPLEGFRGYVAGPSASMDASAQEPEPLSCRAHEAEGDALKPDAGAKKRRPWLGSGLFVLLAAVGTFVALRDDANVETEVPTASPSEESVARAEDSVAEPQVVAIAPSSDDEQSLPVAVTRAAPAPAPAEISFTTRTLQVGANQTVAALTVKRSNSSRGRARVAWSIEGGTAKPGVHYAIDSPQLIEFLDGQSVRSLFIPLTPEKDADNARHSKTFTVKLKQASGGATLGEIKQVYVTIVGDVPIDRFAAGSAPNESLR